MRKPFLLKGEVMRIKKRYSQNDLAEVVDVVFSYLENNRLTITKRLFPNADMQYLQLLEDKVLKEGL